jgi:hypothetical protein
MNNCCRRALATVFWFVVSCALSVAADECSGTGTIRGQVVNSANHPVANVQVGSFPLGCAIGGIIPAPVRTDVEGRFILTGVSSGLNAVYTSKPENGYPDTSLAFYAVDFPPRTVVVRAGHTTDDVIIRLDKAEIVAGKIVDEETSQPLLDAWIRISRADRQDLRFSLGPTFSGDFRFLLPAAEVRIEITARGYEPWLFTGLPYDLGTSAMDIGSPTTLKTFGTRHLDVKLRKLHE